MKIYTAPLKFNLARTIRHIPGTLQVADYRRLLEALEVEDVANYKDDEIEELAFMALQDRDHGDAMNFILSTFYEGQFTPGQIQNLTEELKEECAWDEYSDLMDHRALYVCCDIMNAAFSADYPEPALTHLQIAIQAEGLDSVLAKHPLNPAMLLRGCLKRGRGA